MAVAPSYEKYKKIGEPYSKNGKMYIKIEHPNTHNIREARWYSEAEYVKAYGVKSAEADKERLESIKKYGGLKKARGFHEGDIYVIRGNKPEDDDWLRMSIARRAAADIDWYIASCYLIPPDIPKHFKLIPLTWEEFVSPDDDQKAKSPAELNKIIAKKERLI